jgi:hypothetical protein
LDYHAKINKMKNGIKIAAAVLLISLSQLVIAQNEPAKVNNGIARKGNTPKSTSVNTKAEEPVLIYSKEVIGDDTTEYRTPEYTLKEVPIYYFKTDAERNQYFKYKSRIMKVMPYVKIAKQLYVELEEEKANNKRKDYKHYRKDVEKEMRQKFEAELKDLTIGQGEMLFKLINRETGNNAYSIIKELKGPAFAWFAQIMAKRYDYNLKDHYDPEKEKMIELIIRELGDQYNV